MLDIDQFLSSLQEFAAGWQLRPVEIEVSYGGTVPPVDMRVPSQCDDSAEPARRGGNHPAGTGNQTPYQWVPSSGRLLELTLEMEVVEAERVGP